MKKYLSLAAVLGAIAIVGVSFLAQAEPEAAAVTTTITTEHAADAVVAPVVDTRKDCEAKAAADVSLTTDAAKMEAVEKCLAAHVDASTTTTTTTTTETEVEAGGHAAE